MNHYTFKTNDTVLNYALHCYAIYSRLWVMGVSIHVFACVLVQTASLQQRISTELVFVYMCVLLVLICTL